MIHADLLVQDIARERAMVDRCYEAIRDSRVLIENSKTLRDKCAALRDKSTETRSRALETVSTIQITAGLLCRWPLELAS